MTTETLKAAEIFTIKHKPSEGEYCWAVALNGKPLVWNRERSESEDVARRWNKDRVRTAREMALTPHNLDRRGNVATTPGHEVWVWQQSFERWVRTR